MKHLPFDVSRCNNTACPKAHECLRFLDWPKDGAHRLPMTSFPHTVAGCENFILFQQNDVSQDD